ncbi:MAG: hypothetical protein IH584_05120 [Candidatus Aminicenantes bacterium]|nr:hypothetical protein [Candidatus Aminicenantes bacterium]
MFSPKNHFRSIAVLEIVSFFFILAVRSLPLAAQAELKKPQVAASSQAAATHFVEQAGNSVKARVGKSRLLPSLLGLAVAGAVIAVLVLTVFKKTGYNPHIIPMEFVRGVDNLYFPLLPGQTRHYQTTQDENYAEVTVTATGNTRLIMGVLCLGVQERLVADQRLFEDTWRWYAQDQDGNVWYFARETKKYDYDVVSEDWSWQAGINGAKPGMVMVGQPADYLNKEYREEYVVGVEETKAQVLGLNETVTVPYGTFSGCLKIKVYSDLDPGRVEHRYYASGIGLILRETVPESDKRLELVSIGDELPAAPENR